jgi:hypothetical protein
VIRRLPRVAGHLALIAVTAWLLAQMFRADVAPRPLNLALWLALGAIVHDLVLLPAYAVVDRLLRRLPATAINHVRVPLVVSGVLLLVYFPLILERRPSGYVNALGRQPPDFLGRWLAITAGVAAASALLYALRRVRAGRAAAHRPAP